MMKASKIHHPAESSKVDWKLDWEMLSVTIHRDCFYCLLQNQCIPANVTGNCVLHILI